MTPQTLIALLMSATLVTACGGTSGPPPQTYARADPVDMSGDWEVDHARSDNIQQRFNGLARQLQREMERRTRAAERGQAIGGSAVTSGRDLLALAEMAELITAPTLLHVIQTASEVRLKRENTFGLVCNTDQRPPAITVTPVGTERCGWDGHQLFFDIALSDGLQIRHRITRSALAEFLVIQTAVYSPSVKQPFVVNKIYNRYDPRKAGYQCTQTLSRGTICTTEESTR